ncbi:MAG: DUF996 domain-containing protein [Candidatus Bathyarchaeia archaeon]|jgi:uncharacterized membrane protein
MSSFESSKNLASIGAILLFLSFIPVVGIIGLILVFIGMKGLADYYKEPSIYQNALMGLIFGIIALVALTAGLILAFTIGIFTPGIGAIFTIFAVLVVVFIFYVIAAMYLKRAFSSLAQKTGEHSFETAGFLLWIGAILTIVFIGLVLIFIAWIFATIAFFSIKEASQPTSYVPPPPTPAATPPPAQLTRFCPNCGAPVQPNTAFCPNCGKPLTP